eukprot:scaffold32059_cov26-Tisochrysis_lutea.AAC.2
MPSFDYRDEQYGGEQGAVTARGIDLELPQEANADSCSNACLQHMMHAFIDVCSARNGDGQ